MPSLGTAYILIRADSKHLKAGLDKAKGQVKRSVGRMQAEISRMTFNAAKIGALAFSAAVVVTAKKMVDLGREFERNMKTVQAWSGATGKGLQDLTNIAREMGAKTEWSATQAAGALKFLAAAGFSAAQGVTALPQTLDLATAGQVDLATATDITTDVLTAFGLGVSELNRVNDAFITTTSSSNTNVTMLGMSMKMVAPTAKLFGMTVEQTAAMLGSLANAGVKAEMAGSGLNMVLLKSARAAKMLSLDAGTPLVEVLKKMKEEQWGAVKIGEAFGARQVKTAAILMDNIPIYEALTKKINENKGSTQALATIIRDSLDNDLKILSSTIEEELLRVFDFYKKDMREMTQLTTEWVRAVGPDALKAIDNIKNSLISIRDVHSNLSGISAVTEIGLVGWVLLGSSYGKTLFLLSAINDGMKTFGMNVGTLIDKGKEFSEVWNNIADVMAGRRDWQTGLPTDPGADVALGRTPESGAFGVLGRTPESGAFGSDQTEKDTAQQKAIAKSLEIDALGNEQALAAEYIRWEQVLEIQEKAMDDSLKIRAAAILQEKEDAQRRAEFDQQYAEMGKSRFEIERMQLEQQAEAWRQHGVDKTQIAKLTADKMAAINKAEAQQRISNIQNVAGSMADNFKMISEMGGKHSKEAFAMYKAFKITETLISTYSGAMKAFEALAPIPIVGPALGIAAAAMVTGFGLAQVAMIKSSQPPSYETGTDYVPETGLALLHKGEQVIPSNRVPAKTSGGGVTIIMENPVFQDLATQRQVFAQIAEVVAKRVAPGAVIQNYNDGLQIRDMVRGGA